MSEAKSGAIRDALAAGIGVAHQGVGYFRDRLATGLLPRRLASLVASRQGDSQRGPDARPADPPDKVEIEDLNVIKALVEKLGAARVVPLVGLLGDRNGGLRG